VPSARWRTSRSCSARSCPTGAAWCASPTRISLIERYAAIEQLRLGERLRMSWDLDNAPMDALLPPLVLQPLLENAVYHGVEPGAGIGDVLVRIERRGERVHARIENPMPEAGPERARRQPHGARQHPRAPDAILRRRGTAGIAGRGLALPR
jgi:sensor histidine kinase YesM